MYELAIQWNEPLCCGHHWEPSNCPDCRGVLNSEVLLYRITTKASVHIGVLIPYFRGVHSERFHCSISYQYSILHSITVCILYVITNSIVISIIFIGIISLRS